MFSAYELQQHFEDIIKSAVIALIVGAIILVIGSIAVWELIKYLWLVTTQH